MPEMNRSAVCADALWFAMFGSQVTPPLPSIACTAWPAPQVPLTRAWMTLVFTLNALPTSWRPLPAVNTVFASTSQVTAPVASIARMYLPATQLPDTRAWTRLGSTLNAFPLSVRPAPAVNFVS